MIYAGIGARKTPGNILHAMIQVGTYMAAEGHVLRSGGAPGADHAFEIGCDFNRGGNTAHLKKIYLPWERFENHNSTRCGVSREAMDVAALFHPGWSHLGQSARLLMGRNSYQILGTDLKTKADFVVCWTLGGQIIGGTGQALCMALFYEIPVINFGSAPLNIINDRLMRVLENTT